MIAELARAPAEGVRGMRPPRTPPPAFADRPAGAPPVLRRCACGGSCPRCAGGTLRRLAINTPGDAFEREADRMAAAVMSGAPAAGGASSAPGTTLRRCACGGSCPSCAGGEEQEEELHRAGSGGGGGPGFAPPIVHQVLSSPGRPLAGSARGFMEARFGADFSGVRVHDDARAAESARAVDAHAYTVGSDLVFAAGRYAPGTPTGDRLLAHELAHTLQEGGAARRTLRRQGPGSTHAGESGGSLSRLAGIPYEKWAEQIEQQYRLRGDLERAGAVRACRTQGAPACARILTIREVHALWDLARSSGGDSARVEAGLAGLGMVAPQLQPPPGPVFPPPLQAPPVRPPLPPFRLPPVSPTPVGPTPVGPTPGPTTGPTPGPGIGPGVGIAIIVTILVTAGIQLWELARFQEALRAQGYIILEDPLAVCIGGCHQPTRPMTPFPEFPSPPLLPGWEEMLRPQPRPQPQPQPQTEPQPQTTPQPVPVPAPEGPEETRATCATRYPGVPLCSSLPSGYVFRSPQAALNHLKRELGRPHLRLTSARVATRGPCPGTGMHYGVKDGGDYVASIGCCPCCEDTPAGPVLQTRCKII